MTTTVHVDIRQLSGTPTDLPVPFASLRVAPAERVIDGDDDYVLVETFLTVRIIDGVAEFDVPATEVGQALLIAEEGFGGARIWYAQIPDQADVNYGDLVEVDPDSLNPLTIPEDAWWNELNNQVIGGEVVGDDLILERLSGATFNAGNVRGEQGPPGSGGGGDVPFIYPETYGATGDGTTDDTDAIQDAIDFGATLSGAIIAFQPGLVYRAAGLVLKSGVVLQGGGAGVKWASGNGTATITPPTGWAGGWVIDSPGTNIVNAGVIGLLIHGGVVNGASPNTGGIRIQNGTWCTIDSNSVAGCSLGAVKIITGTANVIRFNALSNSWAFRTLASAEGVLWVTGTDAWIENNQCNSLLSLSATVSTNIDNLYQCANLLSLFTSWVWGGSGEFSEVGWKMSMYQSSVVGIRADTNPGIGMYVTLSVGGGTRYSNLVNLANCTSPAAHGVLAQMYVADYGNRFDGILFGPDWTGSGNVPRYGLSDTASLAGLSGHEIEYSRNVYTDLRFNQGSYMWDEAVRVGSQRFSYKGNGSGNPGQRPPSRFAGGNTWWDTVGNQLTISDGANWKSTANAIVGNILLPTVAHANDGVLRWDVYASTCTLALGTSVGRFLRPNVFQLTTTATGVTTGFIGIQQKSANAQAVTAGNVYQVGCVASGPVGKSPTGSITVTWLNAGAGVISTTTAVATTAIGAGDAVKPTVLLSAGITAPALAVNCLISFIGDCTGLATSDVFKVTAFSLTNGSAQTDIHEI